jgi:tRNA pseudouridine55 synthase
MSLHGLLNIHKLSGVTSRDVVNDVQRMVRPAKAGHAGTLDPLASGVLVVGVGAATRLLEYVQQMRKRYEVTFRLGCRSDTDDVEGTVVENPATVRPAADELAATLSHLVGEIRQRPPVYSAIKVGGQRAYALARRGTPAELAPRTVTVYGMKVLSYEYPLVRLAIECGTGTYIRAIGRDWGEQLGTGAVMTELCRTAVGGFCLESAVSVASLTREALPDHLLPPLRALDGYPRTSLTSDEAQRAANGQFVARENHGFREAVAGLNEAGELLAVLRPHSADQLRPVVVMKPKFD